MVTSPLWKNLRLLVDLDQEKETVASQIRDIEEKIEEDNLILPKLEAAIAELKQASLDAKKNVDLQELNAASLKDKETEKRKALDIIKKQKEHTALEKELNSILQQLYEQDDALIQAWHNLESANKKEEEEVVQLSEKIELLQKDIGEKKNSIKELQEKLKVAEQNREKQATQIPDEWLLKYERMKNRVPDPIVPVTNTSCSSCYYSIPPQDFARLKRSAILPCRSCYRLLYYNIEETTPGT